MLMETEINTIQYSIVVIFYQGWVRLVILYRLKNILKMLEILEDCIVFPNERIYISALYRRHKCAVQEIGRASWERVYLAV